MQDQSSWDLGVHWHRNWHRIQLFSKLMIGYSVTVAFFPITVITVLNLSNYNHYKYWKTEWIHWCSIAVQYGIERMNREVSLWMKGLAMDDYSNIPFTAMKGYNSVVWSRLYSKETSDLNDHQINQVVFCFCPCLFWPLCCKDFFPELDTDTANFTEYFICFDKYG